MRASASDDRAVRVLFAWGGATAASILPFFVLLLRDRHLAPDQIGLVVAVSSLTGVAASPVWSHAADERLGTVRALELATVASGALALVLATTGSNLPATIIVVGALGVAQAPTAALADAFALGHLGFERETDYGSIRMWASIGWAVAVVVFGWLFQSAGFDPLLPLYAGMILAYAVLVSRLTHVRPEPGGRSPSKLGSLGDAFRGSPALRIFVVGLFLIAAATSAVITFVPLRISSSGGGPFLIGLSAGIAAVIEIPFFRTSGLLGSRFGIRALFVTGTGVFMLLMLGFSSLGGPVAASVLRAAWGAGFGLMYPALVVIGGRLVPPRLRNTGQAIVQATTGGISPIVGSGVGGLVYQHLGPATLFAGAAAVTGVGTFVVWTALSGDAFSPAHARA